MQPGVRGSCLNVLDGNVVCERGSCNGREAASKEKPLMKQSWVIRLRLRSDDGPSQGILVGEVTGGGGPRPDKGKRACEHRTGLL